MSQITAIDLSLLPVPDAVEVLDFETILAAMIADLTARAPELAGALATESDPLVKDLQVGAYRELLVRARINDAVRAGMLATAKGGDLANLAALFGVQRLVVTPADPAAIPPVAEVLEGDDALRLRTQLALDGFSTAGPRAAYEFHARSADARVSDVAIDSPEPGVVRVLVLSNEGDGQASEAVLTAVNTALNAEDVRPLCDSVLVQSAQILPFAIDARLTLLQGPDTSVILAEAQQELARYLASIRGVGRSVRLSGIYAALNRVGVENVTLISPTADVVVTGVQAANCTAAQVQIAGAP